MAVSSLALMTGCSSRADEQPADLPEILTGMASGTGNYLPDFSYAGYEFGTAPLPAKTGTVISVTGHGAVANDEIDDSRAVLAAFEAARDIEGPVTVEFPAGRFILSDILFIDRSDFILKGAGSGEGGTTLHFPRPLTMIDQSDALDELREYIVELDKRQVETDKNLDVLFSEYSWSGGMIWVKVPDGRPAGYLPRYDAPANVLATLAEGTRGERTIRMENNDSLSAGDVVQVQWFNRAGEDGPLIDEIYNDPDIEVGSHHWTYHDRALARQMTRIEAIDGDMVTIADPLLHDISADLPAYASQWDHLSNIGIEGLRLEFPPALVFGHHVEQGYNGIYLTSAFNSWISDVEIANADSGILTYDSASVTIRDIETTGTRMAHYSVHIGNCHNMLVEGLTVRNPVLHDLSFNTQSTKSVYLDTEVFDEPVLDQHAGANHQNLFDNVTLHITPVEKDGKLTFPVWDGSGAGYWQPGHGAFNTTWNLKLVMDEATDETIVLEGLAEGPNARIIGLSGNGAFALDYRPAPYTEFINQPVTNAPSLYRYQLQQRTAGQ
ncbi:right-handed parallel beta-helix repeat-containing protein [Aquisalinus flavus]|nr:right-handed parallel beta-helix repeat-containing protein [Aquisalinus flavus]UNE47221.1 right-handed parallel beta-helix repeat-containing protein [Aquisalinus flavus]